MPTPSIQTLRTDAQQVLNLDSISAVRSVVAATLANANAGTPLNPNLTTQQLWNEFYQIVTQPKSDIESIIANQLMKFLYAPPAPGGAGANHEVIYNNNGVLAGDSKFLWDDALNRLDIDGSATISGDLTVDTSTLKVDSTNNRVGIGTTNTFKPLTVQAGSTGSATINQGLVINSSAAYGVGQGVSYSSLVFSRNRSVDTSSLTASVEIYGGNAVETSSDGGFLGFRTQNAAGTLTDRYTIDNTGISTWSVAGTTAMTLNSTGLGVGGSPSARIHAIDSGGVCALFTRAVAPAAALSAVYIQAPVSSGFSSTPVLNFWYQNTGISNPASETMSIRTNNAERIRYGSDGNAYHSLQGTVPTIPNDGEMVFNFTSNTNLRISARGSDGVTRVANITLA